MSTDAKKKLVGLGFGDNIQSLIKSQKEIDLEKLHSDVQYLKATLQTYGLSIKRDPIDELQKINKWEVDLSDATIWGSSKSNVSDLLVDNLKENTSYLSSNFDSYFIITLPRLYPVIDGYVYELKSCHTHNVTTFIPPSLHKCADYSVFFKNELPQFYCILKKSANIITMEDKYNFINCLYTTTVPKTTYTTSSYNDKINLETYLSTILDEDEIMVQITDFNSIGVNNCWVTTTGNSGKWELNTRGSRYEYVDINKVEEAYFTQNNSTSYLFRSLTPNDGIMFSQFKPLYLGTPLTFSSTSYSYTYNPVSVNWRGSTDYLPFTNSFSGAKRNIVYEVIKYGNNNIDHIDGFIVVCLSPYIRGTFYGQGGVSIRSIYGTVGFSDYTTLKFYNKKNISPLAIVKDEISIKINHETGEKIWHPLSNDFLKMMLSGFSDNPSYQTPFESNECYYIGMDNPTPIRIV